MGFPELRFVLPDSEKRDLQFGSDPRLSKKQHICFLSFYIFYLFTFFAETPSQIRGGGNNSARPPRQTGGGEGSQH